MAIALGTIVAAGVLVTGASPAEAAGTKTVRVKIYTGTYSQTAVGGYQFTTCGGNITWLLTLYINMSKVTTTGAQVNVTLHGDLTLHDQVIAPARHSLGLRHGLTGSECPATNVRKQRHDGRRRGCRKRHAEVTLEVPVGQDRHRAGA